LKGYQQILHWAKNPLHVDSRHRLDVLIAQTAVIRESGEWVIAKTFGQMKRLEKLAGFERQRGGTN
jgi:hypothetical protein